MAQPDSISGSLPEFKAEPAVQLGQADREQVLRHLSLGTGIIWLLMFLVTAILLVFVAPPGFRFTLKGALVALGFLLLTSGGNFLQVRHFGRHLADRELGPESYRLLTRFPQSSSLLYFLLGLGLSGGGYLWMKLYLGQSVWISFITAAMFATLVAVSAICHYFIAKQNLMRLYKLLAGQPGFNASFARFSTSLRAKFGFGFLGTTGKGRTKGLYQTVGCYLLAVLSALTCKGEDVCQG